MGGLERKKIIPIVVLILTFYSCENEPIPEKEESIKKKQELYNGVPISEKEPDNYTGEYLELYNNSLPKMRGQKVDGIRQGKWKSWHFTGAIASEGTYIDGKEDGIYTVYFDNGQIRHKGRYEMGKQTGNWKFYSEEGELLLDSIFN